MTVKPKGKYTRKTRSKSKDASSVRKSSVPNPGEGMDLLEINSLLSKAQSGDEEAKNKLIYAMLEDGCMKRLSRYLYLNRLLEPDEVRGEFWLGVAQSINKAKPLGNPLRFLHQCGVWQVVAVLRQRLSNGVSWACLACGKGGSLNRRATLAACPRCASIEIETKEKVVYIGEYEYTYKPQDNSTDFVEDFKTKLQGRELQVFNLIVDGCDRDSTQNYIKEIANTLKISPPCVAIYLRRIRYKLKRHLDNVQSASI